MAAAEAKARRKRETKPKEVRMGDLLDASAAIFIRDGVADAKVEDITAAAGVSKGTFYLYFQSKEEAAAAVWRRHIDQFIAVGESILGDEARPVAARLVDIFKALMAFAFDRSDLHLRLYKAVDSEAVKMAANEKLIALITDTAKRGIETGEVSCAEPRLVVTTLYHGLCGAFLDVSRSGRSQEREALLQTAGDLAQALFTTR